MRFIKRVLRFFFVDLPLIILLALFCAVVGFFILIHKFFIWITDDDLARDLKKCRRGYSE